MQNRTHLTLSIAMLVVSVFSTLRAQSTSFAFSRYAGVATVAGSNDGTNSAPQFNVPLGLAIDAGGNLYVADTASHTVRKVTPAGVTTTLAGSAGSAGSSDGTGSSANFNFPGGVWSDAAGTVYVTDTNNHTMRRITPAGVVTTFAGSAGAGGADDGAGSAARFSTPMGVAGDALGNVYLADTGNHTIRKISPSGVVTTLAGSGFAGADDGAGSAASFRGPHALAVDSAGNIYVADAGNHTIRKITAGGVVNTLAGTAGVSGSSNGAGAAARFNDPHGVAVDGSGTVFIADTGNNLIRRISAAGATTTVAGSVGNERSVDGVGIAARFQSPNGIAVDAAGVIFVADSSSQTLRRISTGGAVTTFVGSPQSTGSANGTGSAARFNYPTGIAIDSAKNLFIADTDNNTIRKITPGGVITTFVGLAGVAGEADGMGSAARFYGPKGIAVDAADNLYVADTNNRTVRKITPDGVVTTIAGGNFTFLNPVGIAVDPAGNVYVSDITYSVIFKLTPAGSLSVLAGSSGLIGFTDGTGPTARFQFPIGLTFDPPSGNLYVADTGNNAIRRVTLAGVVSTVAGASGTRGSLDGPAATARFDRPFAVALDAGGSIFVADFGNTVLRQITPAGIVLTIGGTAGIYGRDDGIGAIAQFNEPTGIVVERSTGTLYVVDQGNQLIRIGTRSGQTSIGTQPAGQTVTAGQSATFSVAAAGTGLSYQWLKNGAAIGGATGTNLTINAAQSADVGSYSVRITGAGGTVESAPATLTVNPAGPAGPASRLSNLSVRTAMAAGQTLIVGVVVAGGPRAILVRAVGPALAAFGLPSAMADPRLDLYQGSTLTFSNDDWPASLAGTFASVGAFPLPAGSKDAAFVQGIDGGYSIWARGTGPGVVLVEAYDTGAGNSPRLINVSARNAVGTGDNILIAGFNVTGTAPKQLLIRAVGPGLAVFGVGGFLADPKLELYDGSGVKVTENDDWSPALAGTFTSVGAFGLGAGSKDAALLTTVTPGSYTVQVKGADGGTGEALIEIYEVPQQG